MHAFDADADCQCDVCSKKFASENTYQTHVASKKHRDAVKVAQANPAQPAPAGSHYYLITACQIDRTAAEAAADPASMAVDEAEAPHTSLEVRWASIAT